LEYTTSLISMCKDGLSGIKSNCGGKCVDGWKGPECRTRGKICRFVNLPIRDDDIIGKTVLYDKQCYINISELVN